jgi:PHP family Zn ribbon phosphoesterase
MEPMIAFSCHACRKSFSVKEELAGKKGQCPACGQVVVKGMGKLADLTPLKGMNLTALECTHTKVLESINGKSATGFWKEVDAKKP